MRTKKYLCKILLVIVIFTQSVTFANQENLEEIDLNNLQEEIIDTSSNVSEEPKINSRAAIAIDRKSKKILFSKNENSVRPMASTTKIMTAIIVLENTNLDNVVIVSKKAANTRRF